MRKNVKRQFEVEIAFKNNNNLIKRLINCRSKHFKNTSLSRVTLVSVNLNVIVTNFISLKLIEILAPSAKNASMKLNQRKLFQILILPKHVLENDRNINFDINKDSEILHTENNNDVNSVLEELHVHCNGVKKLISIIT